MEDYKRALVSWMRRRNFSRLIICENSGADLSELQSLVPSTERQYVEFLSYTDFDSGPRRGKGYAELGELDYVLRTANSIESSDVIVKCTGRLTIGNAVAVINSFYRDDFDVICDLRKYLTYADTRIFAAKREFIEKYLIPVRELINDQTGTYLEHALARAVTTGVANGMRWRPFEIYPEIIGISGSTGEIMTDSMAKKILRRSYYKWVAKIYRR